MIALLLSVAYASGSYDPASYVSRFTETETYTIDGGTHLWSAIELHKDTDPLFDQEQFNDATAWPTDSSYAPWVAECFGSSKPNSNSFLLHMGTFEESALGTPILFVPGAGDNGSRGFIGMATHENNLGRPVYALTFAHPHGDSFMQAEVVADAIARIKERTGASQVDVVSHSKGGIATAIYLSNSEGADWGGRTDYETRGTTYRGDVRRAVFIATPLGGIDTAFRWSSGNYASLDSDTAMAPTSWSVYYPYTSSLPAYATSLMGQDFFDDASGDLFPGQRQLIARWDDVYDLPGSNATLGIYALQQDWYTTYEGGAGYYSYSPGIDAVIDEGDDVLGALGRNGVDAGITVFVLAGESPIMPNGSEAYYAATYGETFIDMATASLDTWADFAAALLGDGLVSYGFEESDLQGLIAGKLILGEVSGPSDGLVFVDSATKVEALNAKGADIAEVKTVNLSHLDLLYASPITGQLMLDAAAADPLDEGWREALANRYIEADTIGWLEDVLADSSSSDGGGGDGGTTDDTGAADGGTGGDDTATTGGDAGGDAGGGGDDAGADGKADPHSNGCSTSGSVAGLGGLLAAVGLLLQRRR